MEFFRKILNEEDTVDLTPMIDVVFLLLIYFMVTTMLKQPEAELSIQLPGKPQNSELKPMPMVQVMIGDSGEVLWNGSVIESPPPPLEKIWASKGDIDAGYQKLELVKQLKAEKKERDDMIRAGKPKEEAELKVEISSSSIAAHQHSVSVLNACAEAGVEKITFAFD